MTLVSHQAKWLTEKHTCGWKNGIGEVRIAMADVVTENCDGICN